MEKKENLNKYWWHRLYKVLLWSLSTVFAIVLSVWIWSATEFVALLIAIFIAVFVIIFFLIALKYKLILYVVRGTKISLNQKERIYLYCGIILLITGFVIFLQGILK